MATIALTGGTGLLGSVLLPLLCSRGHRLRVLARPRPSGPRALQAGITWIDGNLDDIAAIDALVHDADCILHAAYAPLEAHATAAGSPTERWLQANFVGTMRLLERTAATRGRQLIYTSSLAVFGPDPALDRRAGVRDEEFAVAPPEFYGSLRAACETMLRTAAVAYGLNTSMFRLGCVLGLRTPIEASPLFTTVDEAVRLGEVRTRVGTYAIAVEDAAAILADAVGDASVHGQVFHTFDRWLDHAAIAPQVAALLGRPVRVACAPAPEPNTTIRGERIRARHREFTTDACLQRLVPQLVQHCRTRIG